MEDIDAAFDDAYRTIRIEAGDHPSTLPNPYSRPSLADSDSKRHAATNSSAEGGGGFIAQDAGDAAPSGGGFIVDDADDDGAGDDGFAMDDHAPGGFLPDDDEPSFGQSDEEQSDQATSSQSEKIARPSTIPLSAIPEALANLGLDSADPSVLSLFADTAYIPSSSSRRRSAPGAKPEKVVGRQEFQQVASVLIDEMQSRASSTKKRSRSQVETDDKDEDGSDTSRGRRRPTRRAAVQSRQKAAKLMNDDDAAGGGGGGFILDDDNDDDSQDDFEASRAASRSSHKATLLDTGSDMTDPDDEYNVDDAIRPASHRRRRRGAAARRTPSPSPSDSDADSQAANRQRRTHKSGTSPNLRSVTQLTSSQRSMASDIYSLLVSHLAPSDVAPAHRRLGSDELLAITRALGEKFTPTQADEMIQEAAKLLPPNPSAHNSTPHLLRNTIGLDQFATMLIHNRLL